MIPSVVPQPPALHRASWDCSLTAASTAKRVSSLHCVPCHCLALLNGVFMCDSVSPPTMVHARGTPCTFSIILRESREHLEQQPPQIVVVRIRALPLVRLPSAWKSFPNTFEVSAELGSERCPLRSGLLLALVVQQTFMEHANTALRPGCSLPETSDRLVK